METHSLVAKEISKVCDGVIRMLVWNLKDKMTMEITQILVDTTDSNSDKVESFLILDK